MTHFIKQLAATVLVFSLVSLVASVIPTRGQSPQSWEALHGPYSGEVVSTLVTSEGMLYAGTALKGLFYRHPDQPLWSRIESPVFDGTQIRALVEYDGGLFAGTVANGVFRSGDGGLSWQTANVGLVSLTTYDFLASHDNRLYVATSEGLFAYGSGGEWEQMPGATQGLSIRTVTEGDSGDLFVGAFATGVLRSTDGGNNWTLANNGLSTTTIRGMTAGRNGELFVGTFGGDLVQRSLDNGNSWVPASNGLESTGVWSVEVNQDGRLFAGSGGGGISYSDDDGDSWHTTNAPQTTVSGFTFLDTGEIVAASRVGVLRSTDGGDTWWVDGIPYSRVNQLLFDGPRLLAGTALGGIHVSDDLGFSWRQTNVNAERVLGLGQGRDGALYGTTYEGAVYRSIDSGEHWDKIWQTIHIPYVAAADSRGMAFAATERGVYRIDTTDPESDWELLSHPEVRVWTIVIDENDVVYTGTEGAAMWRSDDGGETWTPRATDFSQATESIFRIIFMPDGRLAMAPTTRTGVWLSEDDGETWTSSETISDIVVSDLTIGPAGTLVAAGFIGQVFELDSETDDWHIVGPRFDETPIRSIAAASNGTVFIGSDPVGVYQLPFGLHTDVDEDEIPHAGNLRIDAYPNPASAELRIEVAHDKPGDLLLEIFDVTGKRVVSNTSSASTGSRQIRIDTSHLVRGTYLLRMTHSGGGKSTTPFLVVR